MSPAVSIIMPVYNCENYIAESIQSIVNQSFKDFELIIINGGSSDRTVQAVKRFKDQRIRLIDHRERFGLVESRNEGFSLAKGDLVAFQDADDISHRLRIAKQYSTFVARNDLAVLGTSYIRIDRNRRAIEQIDVMKEVGFKDLLSGMQLCNGSVMLRKRTILKEGVFDLLFRQCEDYELYCRLAQKGYRIMNLEEPLYFLRDHPARLSVSKWKEQALYLQLVRDIYSGFLEKREIKQSVQCSTEYLYLLLSPQAKKAYHLYLTRKYIESANYVLGLREFIHLAKMYPREAASLIEKTLINRSKNIRKRAC